MKHMQVAVEEAYKSNVLYKHGCVAVVSGKVVARGYNKYRTFSKDGLINDNCSCHAEIDVLRKCRKKNFHIGMILILSVWVDRQRLYLREY